MYRPVVNPRTTLAKRLLFSDASTVRTSMRYSPVLAPSHGVVFLLMPLATVQPKSMHTSELHALARAGRSWDFLAIATRLEHPDEQTGLLIAASFARLGLATLAHEAFGLLPSHIQTSAAGTNLCGSIAKLPGDTVPFSKREALVEASVAALAARGIDLSSHLGAWREHASARDTFLAYDGNLVHRATGSGGQPWADLRLADERGAASVLLAQAPVRQSMPPPIVVQGITPPWVLLGTIEATSARPSGYAPLITIVEPDPIAFLDGLCASDLSGHWSNPRLDVLVGPRACERLRDAMRTRMDSLIEPLVLTSGPPATSDLTGAIRDSLMLQQHELSRLIAATDSLYNAASLDSLRHRFEQAVAGGASLRVLIPTSRYTTFVKHSAMDLAAALRRAGHEARVLMESRDDEQMSALAYRRGMDEFRPDLVVLVNYPRACLGVAFPAHIPYVCWVQDSMPHLFDSAVGKAHGPLDFVMGHTFGSLFDAHGYPLERAMPAAVVADLGKFHDAPVAPALRSRHECEIAMVTHHSETPGAMHARLSRETTTDAGVRAAMERVFAALPAIVETSMASAASPRVAAIVERAAMDTIGPQVPAKSIEQLVRHYAIPMVDRIFRHQTLEWAAELCKEKNWRLHLYGKGWHTHPTLAAFAKGELPHDEELRAAYQAAGVHLHAGFCSLVHQRVAECALSGGLCLARVSYESLSPYHAIASAALVRSTPDHINDQGQFGYSPDNHPLLRERLELHQRLGIPTRPGVMYMRRERVDAFIRKASIPSDAINPQALFGDLAQACFWSRETFRERMVQAIEQPAWRERVRADIRSRTIAQFTYDSLVPKLLYLVKRGLTAASAPQEHAA
jgi:hypothetical protein